MLFFCLGDLTIPGPAALEYAEEFLSAVDAPTRPVCYVSGNNDAMACVHRMKELGVLLDYTEKTIGTMRVVGIGYEPPPVPFRPELTGAVLLSHVPPRRQSAPPPLANAPKFHFSGHLHSVATVRKLGPTTVVQVPTAMDFRAVLFTWPEGRVEFIHLH